MPEQRPLDLFIKAFANRDYGGCVIPLLDAIGSPIAMRLLIMCLLRGGACEIVDDIVKLHLRATKSDSWDHILLQLCLGRMEVADALAIARYDEERFQAHYYAGAWHLARGETKAAYAHLDECLAIPIECLERRLAWIDRHTPAQSEAEPSYARLREEAHRLSQRHSLLRQQGDLSRAIQIAERVCDLNQKILESHPERIGGDKLFYASSLNNLALLYEDVGRYSEAKQLYEQALEMSRGIGGSGELLIANILNNLSHLNLLSGELADAVLQFRQALVILRNWHGGQDWIASCLNNLAVTYQVLGRPVIAERYYHEAIEVCAQDESRYRQKLHGDGLLRRMVMEHPHYSSALMNLAWLCASTGRIDEAFDHMRQAAEIDDRMISAVATTGSEDERLAHSRNIYSNLERFLCLTLQHRSDCRATIAALLDLALRRKGIVLETSLEQRYDVLAGQFPELTEKVQQLISLRDKVTQAELSGAGQHDPVEYERQVRKWQTDKQTLEAELARQIPEIDLNQRLRTVDHRAIISTLDADMAIVEFVYFEGFNFNAAFSQGEDTWAPARYAAFVLNGKEPDQVHLIDLGEADRIDRLTTMFRVSITRLSETVMLQKRKEASPDPPAEPAIGGAGLALRAAVFDPILKVLGGRRRLLLALDGNLTRLPFEVLPTDQGGRLIDEYRISYLSTARDVLRFGVPTRARPSDAVVIADPDFDLGRSDEQSGVEEASGPSAGALGGYFGPLPGTRDEGERIADILGVQPWLKAAALESRVKTCRSPRILHLATHGFFLPDQQHQSDQRKTASTKSWQENLTGRLVVARLENPLLRSGVALAGANTWLRNGNPPAAAEDGLLTAEDVLRLDLLATELVVLSACDTGLGEVRYGEGVFGLRRAFVLAGAKTLVMSLWKVPDRQTQELMEIFYHYLLAGEPRADALRNAQLEMKAKYPDPRDWGAFICQGTPGPLELPQQVNTSNDPRLKEP